jgi:hypothetical protein
LAAGVDLDRGGAAGADLGAPFGAARMGVCLVDVPAARAVTWLERAGADEGVAAEDA